LQSTAGQKPKALKTAALLSSPTIVTEDVWIIQSNSLSDTIQRNPMWLMPVSIIWG